MITINLSSKEQFELIEFVCPKEGATPEMLADVKVGEFKHGKGVVISGKGPVWLFGCMAHQYQQAQQESILRPPFRGGCRV